MIEWDPYRWLESLHQNCSDLAHQHEIQAQRLKHMDQMLHDMSIHVVFLESRIEQLEKRK